MLGDEQLQHRRIAEQRARENSILARASAYKRKREGALEPEPQVSEPQRKVSHWSNLLAECAWMSNDIRSERNWRKRMAFIIAHEALGAREKLRKERLEQMEALEEAQQAYVARLQNSAAAQAPVPREKFAVNGEGKLHMQPATAPDSSWQDRKPRQWQITPQEVDPVLARHPQPLEASAINSRRSDLSWEDDRLLLCLMTEFGESPTLVAEVFSSIRRLDGAYMDRQSVLARNQKQQPVRKEEARALLRLSMPCSVQSILKYSQVIRPVAMRMQNEAKAEHDAACMKYSEVVMNVASKHESHETYMRDALAFFGGEVPTPSKLLAHRRNAAELGHIDAAVSLGSVGDGDGGGLPSGAGLDPIELPGTAGPGGGMNNGNSGGGMAPGQPHPLPHPAGVPPQHGGLHVPPDHAQMNFQALQMGHSPHPQVLAGPPQVMSAPPAALPVAPHGHVVPGGAHAHPHAMVPGSQHPQGPPMVMAGPPQGMHGHPQAHPDRMVQEQFFWEPPKQDRVYGMNGMPYRVSNSGTGN